MYNIAIGRQPIYDAKLQLVAYELLFREYGKQNQANFSDGNRATTDVILNALTEIGLKTLVGDASPFLNLTESFILGHIPLPEMPGNITLEILEDIPANEQTIRGIRSLIAQGYTIALDDFIYHPKLEPFVNLAHLIKIDIMAQDRDTIRETVKKLKEQRKTLLAEKVETHDDFKFCKSLRFDLYQGYFFCKPEVVTAKTLPVNKLKVINILAKLHDPNTSAGMLENDISSDVTLSYRLLRYINSVHFYLKTDINSIKQAILLLGWDNIRSIATLLVMSRINDKPFELFRIGLLRAKMCEPLGGHIQPRAKDIFFTAGLLSVVDALMDQSMDDVMTQLPLSEELSIALTKHDGIIGKVLKLVTDYSKGDEINGDEVKLDLPTINNAYLTAIQWTDSTTRKLDRIAESA